MHECMEHGHYCMTCEREELDARNDLEITQEVERWAWNLGPTGCAMRIHHYEENEPYGDLDKFIDKMRQMGIPEGQIYDVETAYYELMG